MSERYKFSDYYSSSSKDLDKFNEEIDRKTERNLAALEDIFSQNEAKNDDFFEDDYLRNQSDLHSGSTEPSEMPSDPMEKTGEISSVQIDELKELLAKLKEMNDDDVQAQETGHSQEKGKSYSKALPAFKSSSSDVNQIITSFIACVQLAGITALFGFGWLMYLINHI